MLKISAHVSKKVPLPNRQYSSQQFGASLEMEVSDSQSADDVQERLRRLYAIISRSIDEQITSAGTHSGGQAAAKPDPTPPSHPAAPAANGNGKRIVPATEAQQRAIHALTKSLGMSVTDALSAYGVSDPSSLSVRTASELIDKLKAKQGAARR